MPKVSVRRRESRPGCAATRHGDLASYTAYGCCCPEATTRRREYRQGLDAGTWRRAYIHAVGSQRRLRALLWRGHGTTELAAEIPMDISKLRALIHQDALGKRVHIATAAKIRAACDRLWSVPGTSVRSLMLATERNYAPLAAWDDATIDDLSATPGPFLPPRLVRTPA